MMTHYVNARQRVKARARTSDEFETGVGPEPFIICGGDGGDDARGNGCLQVLFYADKLRIPAESEGDEVYRFRRWKAGMEKRGLKVNMDKTKVM